MMQNSKNFQVYRSSAGSGKTFTLARKFLALTLSSNDPNHFKHILAITFTVKAAHEMKSRILKYLTGFAGIEITREDVPIMLSLVSEDTGLDPEIIKIRSKATLNRVLHHYNELSVLTIDKFVHGIIRSFSSDLGLNNDFEVEIDQSRIVDRTVSQLFNEVGRDPELTELMMAYVNHQTSRDKSWNLTSALEDLCHELNTEAFYTNAKNIDHLDWKSVLEILQWATVELGECIDRIKDIASSALEVAHNYGLSPADFHQSNRGIYGYFKMATQPDLSKVLKPNTYVQNTILENKWQSKTKNEAILEIIPIWTEAYEEIHSMDELISNCKIYEALPPHLFRMGLIVRLQKIMQDIKEEENQQLLGDFYKILSNKFSGETTPFIYERLGHRYNHILIDEFQDTSRLQWKNLLPLVENSLAEGNQSLIVGDAKQSIYRFRGSEPEQFVSLPKVETDAQLLFESEYSGHTLDNNFRSSSSIVEFNNRFFQALSQELNGPQKKTYEDIAQKTNSKENGCVTFTLIDGEEGVDKLSSYFIEMEKNLKRLISNKGFGQSDVCFLFQKNAEAATFSSMLIEAGYNVQSDESLLLKNNAAIQLLIFTLKCSEQPRNDFFIQRWILALYRCGLLQQDHHLFAEEYHKSKRDFFFILKDLKININSSKAGETTLARLTHFCDSYSLDFKDSFIQKLFDFVLEFEQSIQRFKTSFLDYWDSESDRLSIEANPNSDAIQVMTIHKSKGLEFPVVFVHTPTIKPRRLTHSTQWVTNAFNIPVIERLMLPITELQETRLEYIYDEEKDRTLLDSINQLYVAFTRAKCELLIFTDSKRSKKSGGNKASPAASELHFIVDWPEWDTQSNGLTLGSK